MILRAMCSNAHTFGFHILFSPGYHLKRTTMKWKDRLLGASPSKQHEAEVLLETPLVIQTGVTPGEPEQLHQ